MGIRRQFRRNSLKYVIAVIIVTTTISFYNRYQHLKFEVELPNDVDWSQHVPFQPEVSEDFPTVHGSTPRIPHILHQTSRDRCVFDDNIKYIRSFITHNRGWEYYFWTDSSARQLIKERHPLLFNIYESTSKGIKRSDILRYVVIYEFGGVYADTDVENVQPLDRVTRKYSCVIPTEPVEHSALLYDMPFVINNGIMLCSPKHPFFKELIRNIVSTHTDQNVMAATGPLFVTEQLILYNKLSETKLQLGLRTIDKRNDTTAGTSRFDETDNRAVYVPNTRYFTDNIDIRSQGRKFQYFCKEMFWTLSDLKRRSCIELYIKGMARKNTSFVYTIHHWQHSWYNRPKLSNLYGLKFYLLYKFKKCTDIKHIIPKVHLYTRD